MFLAATLVFAVTWGLFTILVARTYGLGWEMLLTMLVTTGLASGGISALSADSRTIIPYLGFILGLPVVAAGTLPAPDNIRMALIFSLYLVYCLVPDPHSEPAHPAGFPVGRPAGRTEAGTGRGQAPGRGGQRSQEPVPGQHEP